MVKEFKWKINKIVIIHCKFNRGNVSKQLWSFGGTERLSKQRFVVTINGPTGDKRNSMTLLPLIGKYIKPGSIINSDAWLAYKSISLLGLCYKHCHQPLRKCWRNLHTQKRDFGASSKNGLSDQVWSPNICNSTWQDMLPQFQIKQRWCNNFIQDCTPLYYATTSRNSFFIGKQWRTPEKEKKK